MDQKYQLDQESTCEQVSVKDSRVSQKEMVPSEQARGLPLWVSHRFLLPISASYFAECFQLS